MVFLVNGLNQFIEIDLRAHKALNFIETGRNLVFDARKIQHKFRFFLFDTI